MANNTTKATKPKNSKKKDAAMAKEVEFVDVTDANTSNTVVVPEPTNAIGSTVDSAFDIDVTADTDVVPVTVQSLQYFPEEVQKNVIALADAVDVTNTDKVIAYGDSAIETAVAQCGNTLKNAKGTEAEEKVRAMVLALAEEASKTYDDFNLTIKPPNPIQKLLYKIATGAREKRTNEINLKAVSIYKLLEQLRDSSAQWSDTLKEGLAEIEASGISDRLLCDTLEQYIVAGLIAVERTEKEVEEAKQTFELSALATDKQKYEDLRDGLDLFRVSLLNLEKARVATILSSGQLQLAKKANTNVQLAVNTQHKKSMLVASQQLRNAVLNEHTQVVMEGQKSLTRLNDELLKKVSSNTVLTAQESEALLLSGVYSASEALVAAQTVINGCNAIYEAQQKRPEAIQAEIGKLQELVNELSPVVTKMKAEKEVETTTSSPRLSGGLKF